MGPGKQCQENGCKELAEHSIHVMLRSRPGVAVELSNPIGYACDKHKEQNMSEMIPQKTWDKMILMFKELKKDLPIRTVCYLVAQKYSEPKELRLLK